MRKRRLAYWSAALLGLAINSGLAQTSYILPAEIPMDAEALYRQLQPEDAYSDTTRNIIRQLDRYSYADIELNDDFSSDLLDSLIKGLDGSRLHFTADDIAEFEQYRTRLDDMLEDGDVSAGYLIYNRYQRRLIDRLVHGIRRIEDESQPFDFTVDEVLTVDRSESPWPANEAELEELWEKRLKSSVLSLKLTDQEMPDIRETLSGRFRDQLSQVLKTNSLDVYQRYMDAMTMTFDPHTQYYAPRAAENFNMSLRLSLEGIGALLTVEDEYTKVVSIVPGGPADLDGKLKPSDRIVGVAQGDDDFTDVIGWRVDDVVQLIRGEKGSTVRLKVIPATAQSELVTEVVSLTRDTVKLEEQTAKKEIVEVEHEGRTLKIGVIALPTFYIDFEALQARDPNYRSSTRDVRNLLEELKAENVDGVVVDLRNNGGGALGEANALVGLFIRRGPTVQIRDADGNNLVQGDPDPEIVYDGPLAVLVNRLSASASEIFAGAIQDYERGLVLGSQTFGKGTVQEVIPMSEGQMKITRAKFYRVTGESTQLRGVTPDIRFPDIFDSAKDVGESALEHALPWDVIEANYYRPYGDLDPVLPELLTRHNERVDDDPDFVYLRAQIARAIENRERNELPLNEETLRAERKAEEQWALEQENARRLAKGLEPLEGPEEEAEAGELLDEVADTGVNSVETGDETAAASATEDLAGEPVATEDEEDEVEEPDPYLIESGRILGDLIEMGGNGSARVALQ